MTFFKPPQYDDAKELIQICEGNDVAVYMGLGLKHEHIGSVET
jgi:hypothetical protein